MFRCASHQYPILSRTFSTTTTTTSSPRTRVQLARNPTLSKAIASNLSRPVPIPSSSTVASPPHTRSARLSLQVPRPNPHSRDPALLPIEEFVAAKKNHYEREAVLERVYEILDKHDRQFNYTKELLIRYETEFMQSREDLEILRIRPRGPKYLQHLKERQAQQQEQQQDEWRAQGRTQDEMDNQEQNNARVEDVTSSDEEMKELESESDEELEFTPTSTTNTIRSSSTTTIISSTTESERVSENTSSFSSDASSSFSTDSGSSSSDSSSSDSDSSSSSDSSTSS